MVLPFIGLWKLPKGYPDLLLVTERSSRWQHNKERSRELSEGMFIDEIVELFWLHYRNFASSELYGTNLAA